MAAQQLVNAEEALELQMGPVINGVPNEAGHNRSEAVELVPIAGVSGDVFLRHGVCAQDTPLVVIPRKPGLADIRELLVFVDLCRAEVAVIIENRHALRMLVIQPACGLCGQEEIVVNETLHL